MSQNIVVQPNGTYTNRPAKLCCILAGRLVDLALEAMLKPRMIPVTSEAKETWKNRRKATH